MQNQKLFLFDIMPLLYRAHFATMGKRFATTTGIDTRTALVFFNYIFQVLTEEKPDAVAAALDSRPVQREGVSSIYKANREKMPGEIYSAFPYALQLLDALHIPILKEEGHEADDIIASMVKKGKAIGYTVFIVSPDKDFAQLVDKEVFLFRPAYKGATMETLDAEGVKSKYGVAPAQIADYLALRGDTVDNIIGVKGIGDKTAATLLAEYHSIEELLEKADTIKSQKIKDAIVSYKEELIENKRLALLTGDLEVDVDPETLKVQKPDADKLLPLLDELQFSKIKERLEKLHFVDIEKSDDEKAQDITLAVVEVTPDAFAGKLLMEKSIALAYSLERPAGLLVFQEGSDQILKFTPADDESWVKLIKVIDDNPADKLGWYNKPLLRKIKQLNYELKSRWIDLSLAAYLLEPDAKIEWLYMKDKYQLGDATLPAAYAGFSYLPALFEARRTILENIDAMGLSGLLFNIELPLQSVLATMEVHGINLDVQALSEIDKLLTIQLSALENKLYEMAGTKFNIGSPSKTAEVLQKVCDIAELKKTKTGQISTAEPFLADLAPKYPFIADLLNYRKLNKIITTYVYSLPKYVDRDTGKIHPTFQQLVAGTGRLSCIEPNLQNLPIRSEAGREVRKAIVPSAPGYSILSIDYNQVELRLMAALSNDEVMLDAFRSSKDIHTTTAGKVFDVDENAVTKDMRSKAKGINFGIAYGITPWGLARRIKVSQKEAADIINAYFEEFSSVKAYLERSINETRERGFTQTPYGRIRYIEGIDSRNGTTRKVAERTAVNAPLQGLAADIIKEAMVAIHEFINNNQLKSQMILQVHDELVFNAADEELKFLVPQLVDIMENRVQFSVPLKVQVTVGKNWLDQLPYNHNH